MRSVSRSFLRVSRIGVSLASFVLALRAGSAGFPSEKRRVTVADAIEMTTWSDRGYFLGRPTPGPVGVFSPDGKQFVVIVKRGRLDSNTNESSLLLFQTKDAFESPRPTVLLTMSSSSNRDAIGKVRWLADNETLAFLGENPGEVPQVYSLSVRTGRFEKLTHHDRPVVNYDISRDGQVIVYEASPRARHDITTEDVRRNGLLISTQTPSDLFLAASNRDPELGWIDRELFLERRRQAPVKIVVPDFFSGLLPLSVSPNGRYAVVESYLAEVPPSWAAYKDALLHPYLVEAKQPGRRSNISHYLLLDTATGEIGPLLDAPLSWLNLGLAWSEDGASIALSGTYLPLAVADPAERELRENHTFAVEVGIPARNILPITSEDRGLVQWNHATGRILLGPEHNKTVPPAAYEKEGSAWKAVPLTPADRETGSPVDVSLQEDINTPPRIFVADPKSGRKALLLDLNPQFSQLRLGKVETIRWKATDGHEIEGGLYFPPGYVAGERYPLVIQTHGFREDRFWLDGPWSSAFAAQPLAAKDIIVLQVGGSTNPAGDLKYANTPEEAARQMAAYEGAIDYLDGRGLIDSKRVGIIGFSRTGFYVAFTLTHSRYRFAAATVADSFDAGLFNFLLTAATDYAVVNGGLPFGPSLASWLKLSPGFNLDKVRTPVRLEYYGWGAFLFGWQSFSGLTLLKKPVDFIWLPEGQHLLVKPWERMASLQGNVDWFLFWLKGLEDADPGKKLQYERWRALRGLAGADGRIP